MQNLAKYLPFKEVRNYVRAQGIRSISGWDDFCRENKPRNIPADPHHKVYRGEGWKGWPDWFGIITLSWKKWRTFREARTFVRQLNLKSNKKWKKYLRGDYFIKGSRPPDIPSQPNMVYKIQGWKSWGDWLGTGFVAYQLRKNRSFTKARLFVRKLGIKSALEWVQYCSKGLPGMPKKPEDIPRSAYITYRGKGWKSWGDWLGTGFVAHKLRNYKSYPKAKSFVKILQLKNYREWR